MAARYEPGEVEKRLMKRWLESGAFDAAVDDARPTYTVPIPPPNVTGSLHMGHALNDTIQDILIRYHHLKGFNTLWVLGTDHAGIATQNKVEARLAGEGLKKEDLGREAFFERVWEWRREYGSTIIRQMQSLGCAADYENERFTMDEAYQKAVAKVFVSLYEKGDIYRDVYLVNWCVRCGSAISDLEVEHEDRASKLYHVKYPVVGSDEFLIVATTRPETIMGDTAVAVNPKDPRYGKLRGRQGRGAVRGPRSAHNRRRTRGHRVRHRRPQDHSGARPRRLGDRHAARPAQRVGHRPGRHHDRRGGRVRGPDHRRGPGGRAAAAGRRGPVRQRPRTTTTPWAPAIAAAPPSSRCSRCSGS